MLTLGVHIASKNGFTEVVEILSWDSLELGKQSFADDGHAGTAVIQDVLVITRLRLCVYGHGYCANLNGTEKGVEKFGRVEQQQEYAVFRAYAKTLEGIAYTVSTVKELLIRDALIAAFDRDVLASASENIAIHEICGNVEKLRQ